MPEEQHGARLLSSPFASKTVAVTQAFREQAQAAKYTQLVELVRVGNGVLITDDSPADIVIDYGPKAKHGCVLWGDFLLSICETVEQALRRFLKAQSPSPACTATPVKTAEQVSTSEQVKKTEQARATAQASATEQVSATAQGSTSAVLPTPSR